MPQPHHREQPTRVIHGAVIRRICAVVLGLLVNGALFGAHTACATELRTGGTGGALGTVRMLAEAYKAKVDPQFSIQIVPDLGSSGALKALERDAIDFALMSRPLTKAEVARGLTSIEYGKTPFVLATSRKDVNGLTLAQIADIYAGKVSRWPDGTPIRLVLRPANNSDTAALGAFSPSVKHALARAIAREGMIVATTEQENAHDIAHLKGALGMSSLALILSEKRPLVALSIDGVHPDVKALADGRYPHYHTQHFAARANPPEAVLRFRAFLQSADGQRILTDTGHWVGDLHHSGKGRAR